LVIIKYEVPGITGLLLFYQFGRGQDKFYSFLCGDLLEKIAIKAVECF
jgi:hypothetical protein